MSWLVQSRSRSDNPDIVNLLDKVSDILVDGILNNEESAELLTILTNISGELAEVGELAKTTKLPLCSLVPTLNFHGGTFLFTVTFAFGNRSQCHEATETLGGLCSKGSLVRAGGLSALISHESVDLLKQYLRAYPLSNGPVFIESSGTINA